MILKQHFAAYEARRGLYSKRRTTAFDVEADMLLVKYIFKLFRIFIVVDEKTVEHILVNDFGDMLGQVDCRVHYRNGNREKQYCYYRENQKKQLFVPYFLFRY